MLLRNKDRYPCIFNATYSVSMPFKGFYLQSNPPPPPPLPRTPLDNNSTENLQNMFKSLSVHLHLSLKLYAKYEDPSLSGSSDILFTRLSLYKMLMSEKEE